ncbi:MAG: hypothetical protein M3114_07775, partial [Thermoproteota archaeon]|nr:hypothetical protein [Thermoproteota archaeon]
SSYCRHLMIPSLALARNLPASFLVLIGVEGTTMEERCRKFVEKVKECQENVTANGPMPLSSNFFNIKKKM